MRRLIKVLKADLGANPGAPGDCIIVQAVRRKFPGVSDVRCSFFTIQIAGTIYALPESALDLQKRAFKGEKLRPMSFYLEMGDAATT